MFQWLSRAALGRLIHSALSIRIVGFIEIGSPYKDSHLRGMPRNVHVQSLVQTMVVGDISRWGSKLVFGQLDRCRGLFPNHRL